jgi:hypothetical protein
MNKSIYAKLQSNFAVEWVTHLPPVQLFPGLYIAPKIDFPVRLDIKIIGIVYLVETKYNKKQILVQ